MRRRESRSLTARETALAASVFGDALDPARVRLHRAKWFVFQPKRVTMAPDGHIWFHPQSDNWSTDFAREPLAMRALFVHEMVHCWQHQRGLNLILRRPPFARYRYALTPGKPFTRYGIEQQACIVEDAYRLQEGGLPVYDMANYEAATYAALIPFEAIWALLTDNRHPRERGDDTVIGRRHIRRSPASCSVLNQTPQFIQQIERLARAQLVGL